jgi:TonB-dependent SusC/RagA subfamily outer membrane receptor
VRLHFLPLGSFTVFLSATLASAVVAQQAVTITGHVSAANHPVQGASVRIQELDVGSTTNADGRYSFIVPSSRVRGQTVTLTARQVRYQTKSVSIVLVGGSMVQDFELLPVGRNQPAEHPTQPTQPTEPSAGQPGTPPAAATFAEMNRGQLLDSAAFTEAPGPVGLGEALAGRVAGLSVASDAALGGSSSLVLRGRRTLVGSNQPLVVVDGTPVDNASFTTAAQRFGFGGFDYGSGAQDVNLGDIASVRVLDGVAAAALYGARGANGVILVSTKSGEGLNGFEVSASQQVTFESPVRLPSYQNAYGQGLAGQFEFFNGRGGGVNDGVAESWGPALNGQPISQASLTEAGQPDVRAWLPQPNNVSGYFEQGRSLITNAAAQGSNSNGSIRLSLDNRDYSGLTPGSSLARRGLDVTASTDALSRLALRGNVAYVNDAGRDRAGTGFDEINPVALFSRMPRQVDVEALRNHLTDARGNEISWNYDGHNNPFFQPLANSNDDSRSHFFGGAGADYAFSSWLTGVAHIGRDSYDDSRNFSVASGWMGGYPDAFGRGSFAGGGSQHDHLSVGQTNIDGELRATLHGAWSPLSLAAGGNWRTQAVSTDATVVDDTSAAGGSARTTSGGLSASTQAHAIFGSARLAGEYASLTVVARDEQSSAFASGHDSHIYPAAVVSFDLARAIAGGSRGGSNGAPSGAVLRAGWSESGADLSRYALETAYAGVQPTDSVTLPQGGVVSAAATLSPEVTKNLELGGSFRLSSRSTLDLSYYHEQTTDLIVAVPSGSGFIASNGGAVTNSGIEGGLDLGLGGDGNGAHWDASLVAAHNTNRVESLANGLTRLELTPVRWGVGLEARGGEPLGAIVGDRLLRNSSGALILRDGLPLPDSVAGPQVLGSYNPSLTAGLTNRFRYQWLELSAEVDGSFGGKIFSASNMWGATSGVLAETAFRPDSGLLISGVDAATGGANSTHVSTEDYYHALRSIPERWVYDASYFKLRDLRVSATVPSRFLPGFRAQAIRASLIGRNLYMWAKAPNIDPETALSSSTLVGLELGQLPTARSIGLQLSITP